MDDFTVSRCRLALQNVRAEGAHPGTLRRDPPVGRSLHQRASASGTTVNWSRDALTLLTPHVKSGTRLLDLGCGQGSLALEFARQGAVVTGLDVSPAAIQVATRLARERGTPATFVVADLAEPLPFKDASFEVVSTVLSLHYFRREVTACVVREIARVSTPGGLLCLYVNTLQEGKRRAERGQVSATVEPGVVTERDGVTRRYFGEDDLRELLGNWAIDLLEPITIKSLGGRGKSCWRVLARRPVDPHMPFEEMR